MKKLIYILLAFIVVSCSKDYMDINSTEVVTEEQLSAKTVQPLITGMYEWMIKYNSLDLASTRHSDFGIMGIAIFTDLSNDDMVMTRQGYGWLWDNYRFTNRDVTYADVLFYWNYFYKLVKASNQIIKSVPENINDLATSEKALYGQAYAFRGMAYHYLVRLYQHTYKGHENDPSVPLITEKTTLEEMRNNPRATVAEIYALINTDLEAAYNLLDEWTRDSKSKIDKNVAAGLRARMYLDMEDWANAAKYASEARSGYSLMSREDYVAGFNDINNSEWMWGAIVTKDSDISKSGIVNFTSHISTTAYGYVAAGQMFKAIDAKLYDQIPASDIRHDVFLSEAKPITTAFGVRNVPKYVNLKFREVDDNYSNDEDYPFMRAAEMYLIEAEALARQGKANAADVLYDFMTVRDPQYTKSTQTGQNLVNEVIFQRQVELWGEGFSFFDHKRLKKAIVRDYAGTNHPTQARTNYVVEDNVYNCLIPISEIENNNGISQSDNNPS